MFFDEVEFPGRKITELAANNISESMNGYKWLLLELLIDYGKDDLALRVEDLKIARKWKDLEKVINRPLIGGFTMS